MTLPPRSALSRRAFLAGSAALAAPLFTPQVLAAPAGAADGGLAQIARDLAVRPYRERPDVAGDLTYDQYRSIRFVPEEALWHGEGLEFAADFFHVGGLYKKAVRLHEIVNGAERPVSYDPAMFDLGPDAEAIRRVADRELAGLRLHHPMDGKNLSEFAVFLGASYFRAIGIGEQYGLSARGIALRSGLHGEEFPGFTAFWLERPAPGAASLVLHALLDGPSLTGAFRFRIEPGATTRMDVSTTLFARRRLENLGIAPLTSMFTRGQADRGDFFDYRPQIHDSEALAIRNASGDRLWRPLRNPGEVHISRYPASSLKGFGLIQRDRIFENYLDLEARYDLRPGLWVEPIGDWGAGEVRLVELPTPDETQDNIVAFWTPERVPEAGDELSFRYRLHWGPEGAPDGPLASVVGSYSGDGGIASERDTSTRKFVIDFARPAGFREPHGAVRVKALSQNAAILHADVQVNDPMNGWRVKVDIEGAPGLWPDLAIGLTAGGRTFSEIWSMR